MDPKLLYHLYEVVEQGSMSQAAISLRITQPTLTRNIKTMEEIIGAPVLVRSRHGVTPTAIGERLIEHGKSVLNAMMSADETVANWKHGLGGEVRLGMGHMHSTTLLPRFLEAHSMDEHNFTLKVVTASPSTLHQQLRSGDIDMAIMSISGQQSWQSLVQIELFSDPPCVLAGSKSPLLKFDGKITKTLLAAQPWVAINRTARVRPVHDAMTQLLGLNNVSPKYSFVGDIAAPIEIMRNSNLLTIIPTQVAEKFVGNGGLEILELDVKLPLVKIALWVTTDNQNDPKIQELTKIITSYCCDVFKRPANNAAVLSINNLITTL